MTTDFFGFSPESFEQFARALSVLIFGAGVSAFGDGPDGGREATFRGEVPYPHPPTTTWSGYGVIQAKCKTKADSTQLDQQWAMRQLAGELQKFVNSAKRSPKPDYYVYVTNVTLTSTAGGGKDQADALIRSYYPKLKLKDHAIWDGSQLTAYVSTYEQLRRAFIAFLTPGDVLATLLAELEQRRPNLLRIITTYLERELRADMAAKLDQAGNRTDDQLRLARLFFDLPASEKPQLLPPAERRDAEGKLPPGVLHELLRGGSRRLDPATVYEQELAPESDSSRFSTRYVLLGGPGSGKSTVGQFLAQVYRAALLDRRPAHELVQQTRETIKDTLKLCEREDLPWPRTPRYPIRIELNRFAKSVASTHAQPGTPSLISYIVREIARDEPLAHSDFLQILERYPLVLILDGLDEVPATSNRDAVVATINDFLATARQSGADLFIIATSRQQGYAGEFGSASVGFRHMLPLSTIRALQYVERYVEVRYGETDPNRAREVLSQMRQSAGNPLTAQLMSSPLQVTFMATVVAARGDPGQNRWQLCENYYKTIYERELQKAVPPYDEILGKYQPVIDRLHHDIGFWLQFTGETAQGLSVSLPLATFELLVRKYLGELGQDDRPTQRLVKRIVEAARHRLVFLTSRINEELSFDVRSLQEYMAAECVMTGEGELVKIRLRSIAPAVYWRNVFLFAASRCFAEARSRHLQDMVRLICSDLRATDDSLLSIAKAGPELALDVLQSGALAENVGYARHLADIALDISERPFVMQESTEGVAFDRRLSLAYRRELKQVYESRLRLLVGQTDVGLALGAWPILLRLIGPRAAWAAPLALQHWPSEAKEQWTILRQFADERDCSRWVTDKLEQLIPAMPPEEVLGILYPSPYGRAKGPLIGALQRLVRGFERAMAINLGALNLRCWVTPAASRPKWILDAFDAISVLSLGNSDWLPLAICRPFVLSPGRNTLGELLRDLHSRNWRHSNENPDALIRLLPWPIAACLNATCQERNFERLSEAAFSGELGDIQDWEQAEERWASQGIRVDDIAYEPAFGLPFDANISLRGWPGPHVAIAAGEQKGKLTATELLPAVELLEQLPKGRAPPYGFWGLTSAIASTGSCLSWIGADRLRRLMEGLSGKVEFGVWWSEDIVNSPEASTGEAAEQWIQFFDWLGRTDYVLTNYPMNFRYGAKDVQKCPWGKVWQEAFIRDPTRIGLLRLLAQHIADGYAAGEIPESLIRLNEIGEIRCRLSALVLLVTRSTYSAYGTDNLAQVAADAFGSADTKGFETVFFRALEKNLHSTPRVVRFLLDLHERTPAGSRDRLANIERLLRQALRLRASDLQKQGALARLYLPEVVQVG